MTKKHIYQDTPIGEPGPIELRKKLLGKVSACLSVTSRTEKLFGDFLDGIRNIQEPSVAQGLIDRYDEEIRAALNAAHMFAKDCAEAAGPPHDQQPMSFWDLPGKSTTEFAVFEAIQAETGQDGWADARQINSRCRHAGKKKARDRAIMRFLNMRVIEKHETEDKYRILETTNEQEQDQC